MPRLTAIVPATDKPATLGRAIAAIEAAAEGPEELVVVREPPGAWPAHARNSGAAQASGEVLVFVDADVEVHGDAFRRIRAAFDNDSGLTALFGSYDEAPAAPGVVSRFRNLLHHHVHQSSARTATTFWAGLGAIRLNAFLAAGGFCGQRFLEDIELGMRLSERGSRIELDAHVLGKHLKRWSLREMLRTDLFGRGVPWVVLLLRARRASSSLNLGWSHRLSAAASLIALVQLGRRRPRGIACAVAALVLLNRSFYALLWRRAGPGEAIIGVALHLVHHAAAAAAVPLGAAAYARERLRKPSSRPSEAALVAR